MQLYFIRNAQSENNAHWEKSEYQEKSDPELTENGIAQANFLAQFLAEHQTLLADQRWNPQNRFGFGLTHLYTSLMVRAVATATEIALRTGLPLRAWPELHETGGIFSRFPEDEMAGLPGNARSYFVEKYPGLLLPEWLDETGWWNRPFEAKEERRPRAESVWQELLARHGDRPGNLNSAWLLSATVGFMFIS